jgi:hypothetical protein
MPALLDERAASGGRQQKPKTENSPTVNQIAHPFLPVHPHGAASTPSTLKRIS